jgi:hypothetical protein
MESKSQKAASRENGAGSRGPVHSRYETQILEQSALPVQHRAWNARPHWTNRAGASAPDRMAAVHCRQGMERSDASRRVENLGRPTPVQFTRALCRFGTANPFRKISRPPNPASTTNQSPGGTTMNLATNPAEPEHWETPTRQNPVPSQLTGVDPGVQPPTTPLRGREVATAVSVVLPFPSYPQSRAQWEVCAFGEHRSHQ